MEIKNHKIPRTLQKALTKYKKINPKQIPPIKQATNFKIQVDDNYGTQYIYPMIKINQKYYPIIINGMPLVLKSFNIRINGIEVKNNIEPLKRELIKWVQEWARINRMNIQHEIDQPETKTKKKEEKKRICPICGSRRRKWTGKKYECRDCLNHAQPEPIVDHDDQHIYEH